MRINLKTAGVFLTLLFAANVLLAQTNDSIVGVVADVAELPLIAPTDLPSGGGTFWVVSGSNGVTAPFPCAPLGIDSDNTYVMPNGAFLVDATAGETGSPSQILAQMNGVSNLVVQAQAFATATTSRTMGMRTMDLSSGSLTPGEGGGTNDDYTNNYTYTPPDYGTNLYIAQWGIVSNSLTGIASNTIADVVYAIQTNSDLTTTNWGYNGQIIQGSETTNWTALVSLPLNLTNQLFFRLQSEQSSDGSGMPDWWEAEYFGTNVVDPYGDPTGDGYNNLYKFQNGMNPNLFYTPAAPQGLAIQVDSTGTNVTLSWQGVRGNVSGYTIYAVYPGEAAFPLTVGTTLASQTTYNTTLVPYIWTRNTAPGYYVTAQYTNGVSSSASTIAYIESQAQQVVQIIPDASGHLELAVDGSLPSDASILLFDGGTRYSIAASNLVNGLYLMPDAFMATNSELFGEILYTNGQVNWEYEFTQQTPTPFYDGRAQLKENLIFQLRSAVTAPFHFNIPSYGSGGLGSFGAYAGSYVYSTNFAYAGLFQFANLSGNENSGAFDPFLPFVENCLFANFVFNLSNVDAGGNFITGVTHDYDGAIDLTSPLTYQFQTNGMGLPDLLATNISRWLFADNEDATWVMDSGLISYATDWFTYYTLSMSSGARNWFGLPYVSTALVWGNSSGDNYTLNAGSSATDFNYDGANLYPETAQPEFQTEEYDFWRAAGTLNFSSPAYALPGDPTFSPTSQIPLLITPVGGAAFQIAGYAKLALQNGYSGVYGYLGQYFDKAYQIDANGIITTNATGILSPYGNFFATQPGAVALVTMPDLDSGERGTGVVNCVSLNVDANHDLTMDLSFNGADATSQANPMRAWINNDYDFSSGSADPFGHDIESQYNANYKDPNITCARDLEDWFRLWICGMPVLTNGYQVTFSWANVSSGSPAINLVNAVETNGGTLYLTDTNTAFAQIADYMGDGYGQKYRTVSTSNALTLPANLFTNNANKYFLFEGSGVGSGELALTVTDSNGNTIIQTGVWLDLHDIKDFYESARALNVTSSLPPSSLVSQLQVIRTVPDAPNESKQIVIFVHGINNTDFGAQSSTETLYKRLYWSGYRGRVAEFKWPCAFLPNNLANPADYLNVFNFNLGEFYAWKSASAFKNYLNYLTNRSDLDGYQINILAHSQGNIVASEAVKLGAPFDNYILTQGAVPAHCYDVNVPFQQKFLDAESSNPTPLYTTNGGYHGYFASLTGNLINFYNTNDFALAKGTYTIPLTGITIQANWEQDQISQKPEDFSYRFGQYYTYHPSNGTTEAYYDLSQYAVTDIYEIMSMVARSRTRAIGAEDGAAGIINTAASVDLRTSFGFGNTRDEHSAEFLRPIQSVLGYYQIVLNRIQPAQ